MEEYDKGDAGRTCEEMIRKSRKNPDGWQRQGMTDMKWLSVLGYEIHHHQLQGGQKFGVHKISFTL